MKVRRLWECECGETSIFEPTASPDEIIVKGKGYHAGNYDSVQHIACTRCPDRYMIRPTIARANRLKKVWECPHTKVLRSSEGDLLIQGMGFIFGSPQTHIKCSACPKSYRIAPTIVWYGQLKQEKDKRQKSRANRRARKRRQA